jgi:hypothetical protein
MESLTAPHWEAITVAMQTLLAFTGQQGFSSRFYLAGGTALALRVGHRQSVDLDFFSETDEVHANTRLEIVRAFSVLESQVIEDTGDVLCPLKGTASQSTHTPLGHVTLCLPRPGSGSL